MEEALRINHINTKVNTGEVFLFNGVFDFEKVSSYANECLGNKLIQKIKIGEKEEFSLSQPLDNEEFPENSTSLIDIYDFTRNDEHLIHLNEQNCWALNLEELKAIQKFYQTEEVKKVRRQIGLPHHPTDVEIEVIAQTWSEHCKHKIFSSKINYQEVENTDGKKLGNLEIKSLFKDYIKKSTYELIENGKADYSVSVFEDNAGIIRFDDQIDHCIKVETHNSPSALDPYGGAITGILGVNRDILGCGMGQTCWKYGCFLLALPKYT